MPLRRSKRRASSGSNSKNKKRSAPSPHTPTRPKRARREDDKTVKTTPNVDSSPLSSLPTPEDGDTIQVVPSTTSKAGEMAVLASRPRRAAKLPAVASSSQPPKRGARMDASNADTVTSIEEGPVGPPSPSTPSLEAINRAERKNPPPRPEMPVDLIVENVFVAGDPPTQKYEAFKDFPPREVAKTMVVTYFEMACPSMVVLHRQTVEKWLEDFLSEEDGLTNVNETRPRKAILFMIFAEGETYMEGLEGEPNLDRG
jgi:hypothetical protein